MWNYLVSALSVGTRLVLYDGSPIHPNPTSQLEILVREKLVCILAVLEFSDCLLTGHSPVGSPIGEQAQSFWHR
jgi:acyl-coenzyme A synthetase/AMP-(fatty) acid ligase